MVSTATMLTTSSPMLRRYCGDWLYMMRLELDISIGAEMDITGY